MENGGVATGTVSLNSAAVGDVNVTLTNSDPAQLTVPENIIIPDGEISATFSTVSIDDSIADGFQRLTLTATAPGIQDSTENLEIIDDDGAQILLVAETDTPNSGEQQLIARLEEEGYFITVQDDDDVVLADANEQDAILISKSVSTPKVGTTFTTTDTPVVTWATNLFDDLGLTDTQQSIDYGYTTGQLAINITNPNHPLSAGFDGFVSLYTTPKKIGWGTVGNEAIAIASLADDPSKQALFAYDLGSTLANGNLTPEKRVALGLDNTSKLTPDSLDLFAATVDWALS